MRFQVARFRCQNGHDFEDVALPGTYGQFVLRSPSGELAAVDAFEDPVFTEVDRIANDFEAVAGLDDARRGRVVRAAFAATIDPDSEGGAFGFEQSPPCPECGTTAMEWFEVLDPPRHVDRDVGAATHEAWEALDDATKRSVIRQAVLDELSV